MSGDSKSVGPSKLVPYIPDEDASHRHQRRLGVAHGFEDRLLDFCKEHGLTLTKKNDGQHWIFQGTGRFLAEWWPSSAKLVFGKKWDKSIHCHDAEQLILLLLRRKRYFAQWGAHDRLP